MTIPDPDDHGLRREGDQLVPCQATLGVARPRVGFRVVVLLGVWLSVFV